MTVAEVIVDVAHSNIDRVYDYFLGENSENIGLGYLVEVPFGNMKINGFVVNIKDNTDFPIVKMKSIIRPIKDYPILTKTQIDLAYWMQEKYSCLLVHSLRVMIPSQLRGDKIREKTVKYIGIDFDKNILDTILLGVRGAKQKAILEYLAPYSDPILVSQLNENLGQSDSSIRSLVQKDLVKITDKRQYRTPTESKNTIADKSVTLNDDQIFAINEILDPNTPNNKYLLHGVTGSGKTEVYMRVSAAMLDESKSVIILVPEISLTPQMVAQFQARFHSKAAVLHSKLSQGERFDEWQRIKSGQATIVIGARSAIFAPVENIGLIVIDEEHETSYKSETQPRYDAVEVAQRICEMHDSILVLGSATPTVSRYYDCTRGEYALLELPSRVANAQMPSTHIVDMRDEFISGNRSIISTRLRELMEGALSRGEKTILFLNRRGYNTHVSCRDCGYVVKCDKCDIAMTYHIVNKSLRCHYCGNQTEPPTVCPECSSKYIKFFGGGTQKLQDEIEQLFLGAKVLRMDADTTTKKTSHYDILNEFKEESSQILIGTQMITKGLDYHDVTVVGVIAADTSLYAGDYRASERTFQLIAQVAGRAGRGTLNGDVVIQTYTPDNYAIHHAANHDYIGFYNEEIQMRSVSLYPPFAYLSRWIFSSDDAQASQYEARKVYDIMNKAILDNSLLDGVLSLDISPARIAMLKGRYRYQLLLRYLPNDIGMEAFGQFAGLSAHSVDLTYMTLEIDPLNMI